MSQPLSRIGENPAEVLRLRARSLATPVVGLVLISLFFAVIFLISGPTESRPFTTAGNWLLLALSVTGFLVAAMCAVGARLLYAMADAAEVSLATDSEIG